MGFLVDFEIGRTITKMIFNATKNRVVKVAGYKAEHSGEVMVVCANGFFYCDGEPLIVTCAHVLNSGATRFAAFFSDGDNFNAMHELKLVKFGQRQEPAPDSMWTPDVAVFSCQAQPPHPPRPYGAYASTADSAYVVGFAGLDSPQLSFNSGVVSSVTFGFTSGLFTIDTYEEPGYSGSPILNIDGFLIGMVKSGHDPNGSKQVTAVPAHVIDAFLQLGEPTLPGISS